MTDVTPGGVDYFRHDLGDDEKRALSDVLDQVMLTTGDVTAEFERVFAEYLGVAECVGVMSCTHALQLGLIAAGVGLHGGGSTDDRVVVPAMTFVATAEAAVQAGATPVLADVDPDTALVTADTVTAAGEAAGGDVRAVMPVHLYGAMVDLRPFADMVEGGVAMIEDAAHAVESRAGGRAPGAARPGEPTHGSCFSFYPTKSLTCGEGGAFAADDPDLVERVRRSALHGMTRTAGERYGGRYRHWDVEQAGWKANLSNLLSAMLVPQVARLDRNRDLREERDARYRERLADAPGIEFARDPDHPGDAVHGRHMLVARVAPPDDEPVAEAPVRAADLGPERWEERLREAGAFRDRVLAGMQDRDVGVAVCYRALSLYTWYRETYGWGPGTAPVAELIGERCLSLPLWPGLPLEDVDRVCDALVESVDAAAA